MKGFFNLKFKFFQHDFNFNSLLKLFLKIFKRFFERG